MLNSHRQVCRQRCAQSTLTDPFILLLPFECLGQARRVVSMLWTLPGASASPHCSSRANDTTKSLALMVVS
jgi:hypothetical protein